MAQLTIQQRVDALLGSPLPPSCLVCGEPVHTDDGPYVHVDQTYVHHITPPCADTLMEVLIRTILTEGYLSADYVLVRAAHLIRQ